MEVNLGLIDRNKIENALDVSNANGLDESFSNMLPFPIKPKPFSIGSPLIMGSSALQKQIEKSHRAAFEAKVLQDKAKAEAEKAAAEVKPKEEPKEEPKVELESKGGIDLSKVPTTTTTTTTTDTSTTGSTPNVSTTNQEKLDENKGKKFLGMPKGIGITVAVVGGLALIVGGILIIRKMRK